MKIGVDTGNWVGVVVGLGGLITALFSWRSAAEANRIARQANELSEGANRLANEANELSQSANTYASEANMISSKAKDVSERALALEHEPQIRIATSIKMRPFMDTAVYSYEITAVNYGKKSVTLQHGGFDFPESGLGLGFSRLRGFNMDDPSFPQQLAPGEEFTVKQMASQIVALLEQRHDRKFHIYFSDTVGNRCAQGPLDVERFRKELKWELDLMQHLGSTKELIVLDDLLDETEEK